MCVTESLCCTAEINTLYIKHISVQFSSVAQSCPTLCDPMNRSTPGLPVHHQLPEFTQTRVHRVSDAIQPSHPWSSPSSLAPNNTLLNEYSLLLLNSFYVIIKQLNSFYLYSTIIFCFVKVEFKFNSTNLSGRQ